MFFADEIFTSQLEEVFNFFLHSLSLRPPATSPKAYNPFGSANSDIIPSLLVYIRPMNIVHTTTYNNQYDSDIICPSLQQSIQIKINFTFDKTKKSVVVSTQVQVIKH